MSAESPASIANAALSIVGTRSTIVALTDTSKEAIQCQIWYDRLRRRLLRSAHWGFARFQQSLSQLGDLNPDMTSPYPWAFKYAYPSDCLKARYVLCPPAPPPPTANVPLVGVTGIITAPWAFPSRANRFVIAADKDALGNQTRTWVTNVQNAIGVYTMDVTNTTLFDDLFTGALEMTLAFFICNALTGNVAIKQQLREDVQNAIIQARVADGNESIPKTDHTPDWIQVRAAGNAYGWGGISGPGTNNFPDGWGSWWGSWEDMTWGE